MNETTAAGLVRAATKLFASRGFEGASIRAITGAAKANLGAVTYHFGSKRGLYVAVVEHATRPLRARLAAEAASAASASNRLAAMLRCFFEVLDEHPEIPRLVAQEILADAPQPGGLEPVREIAGLVAGVVRDGQAAGEFRQGNPLLMAVSVVSQPIHLTLMPRVLGVAPGPGTAAERRAAAREHAVRFVLAGLARGDESG